jgi:hypothetical protein
MANNNSENFEEKLAEQQKTAAEEHAADLEEQVAAQKELYGEEQLGVHAETPEESAERAAQVSRTMIFGDTPTDPTIGDPQVPTSNEEAGTVSVARTDEAADEGDEDAQDYTVEQAKRQGVEGVDEEDRLDADAREAAQGGEQTEGRHQGTAKEVVAKVKEAESVEEVDELVEGDDRRTVLHAAEVKKAELEGECVDDEEFTPRNEGENDAKAW